MSRFFRRMDLKGLLRGASARLPRSDFGATAMVLLLLALLITGGRRIRHVVYLEGDPLVKRVSGLSRIPTLHTVGRWLRAIDGRGVAALLGVNEQLVGGVIERSDLRRLTLDVDGSVVSTGLKVEGARRGFNPHRRKVPSYYPITAYEANSAWQVLSVLAFNLMRGLQASVAGRRTTNRKRRTIRVFETIHTLRFRWLNRAGLLVQPNGRSTLDVGDNTTVRQRSQALENALGA